MIDEKHKLPNPHLEGEIYYLTEKEGGRKNAVESGYRGQFYYDERDWDARQEFIDKEICNPGETVNVKFQTLSPDFHVGKFYVGKEFTIKEGSRIVGHGKITQILRQDFQYWDFNSFFEQLPMKCNPYNFQNIEGFIVDFEYGLNAIKQIEKLKFTKTLSDINQMLTVECEIKDKNQHPRSLIHEICKCWREEIQFKNSHYKIDLKYHNNGFKFELTFATWHSMYLTGKIIVNTT